MADASQPAGKRSRGHLSSFLKASSLKARLLRGSTMLKCGRSGWPHFRHFQVSEDLQYLKWYSPKKASDESKVCFKDVVDIIVGQKTDVFNRNRIPEHEHLSFSLVYTPHSAQTNNTASPMPSPTPTSARPGPDTTAETGPPSHPVPFPFRSPPPPPPPATSTPGVPVWPQPARAASPHSIPPTAAQPHAAATSSTSTDATQPTPDPAPASSLLDFSEHVKRLSLFSSSGSTTRTLDIICIDSNEFNIWVRGLRALTLAPCALERLEEEDSVIQEALSAEITAVPSNVQTFLSIAGASAGDHEQLRHDSHMPGQYNHSRASMVPPIVSMTSSDTLKLSFAGTSTVVTKQEYRCDVYAWGMASNGQLGLSVETDQPSPKIVQTLLGKDIRIIACGPNNSAAINVNGRLFMWGCGMDGVLGNGDCTADVAVPTLVRSLSQVKVVQVACGKSHTMALSDDGTVLSWGSNVAGVLGQGDETPRLSPVPIQTLPACVHVSAGISSSAATTDNGDLLMWGSNAQGQLGVGEFSRAVTTPARVQMPPGQKVSSVCCTNHHTGGITVSGELYMWGEGSSGQLGLGNCESRCVPTLVPMDNTITTVATGVTHTAALTADGRVFTWGAGQYGQLGHGQAVSQYTKPLKVGKPVEGLQILHIACGSFHMVACAATGEMFSWGLGSEGQLGTSAVENVNIPRELDVKLGRHIRQVCCGSAHTLVTVTHGWVPDNESLSCMACGCSFNIIKRRHHCRNCGGIFCGGCSSKTFPLLKDGFIDPVRVCDKCHSLLSSAGRPSA